MRSGKVWMGFYRTILNFSNDRNGNSSITTFSTLALGGPCLHHLIKCSICSEVPVATTRTVSSGIFLTSPFIPNAVAFSLVLCLKKTPCTLPFMIMETVFCISKCNQVNNFFKITLICFIKLIQLFTINIQNGYHFIVADNGNNYLGS